ncbi:PAS domain S-box-containing protein [Georgenia soli]|uniref:PAS domain S-box-containing protein n=1 Tax=Georgenia soli TaxID=638953 RepID=A0A2A9EJ11_9MICO|nr:SpoIIE family protein phosphatase [Georgenia soli]PFG38252.1 PAS domain S-box-containing protein [Georgenia soli]
MPDAYALDAMARAGMGAYRADLSSSVLWLDDRAATLLGIPPVSGPLPTGTVEAQIHPDDRPVLGELVTGALDAGSFEAEFRMAGSPDRWIATRGRVTCEPSTGHLTGVAGVIFPRVRTSLHHAAELVEDLPTTFFSLNRNWRFSYVNTEAERVLGRPRAELLDGDIWELYPAALSNAFETYYRRAMSSGEPVSFDAYYPEPLNAWYEVRAMPTAEGLSVYFFDVTERRRLQEETERIARRAQLTAAVTTSLAQTLDAEEAVAALARTLVPQLADWCVVTLLDADGAIRPSAMRDIGWWHADPAARPLVEEYTRHRMDALMGESFLMRTLRTTDVVRVPDDAAARIRAVLRPGRAQDLITELAPESGTVLPLRGRGRTLGAITLFNGADRPPLDGADLLTAQDIAARAGLALDNAYLYASQRGVAEELQRSFLTEPPQLDHLDVAVRYVPAAQAAKVGGDWFDVFQHPDGPTVVVIGDVTGHDLHAAATMGQLRSMLRGIATTTVPQPAALLTQLDRAIEAVAPGTVATAVVMTLEPVGPDGDVLVRWSNAGHPPPMLLDGEGDVVTLSRTNLLLGIRAETVRTEQTFAVRPGSTLLLYTDGLVERRDDGGLRGGLDRLRATLRDLRGERGTDPLCDELVQRLLPAAPEDDMALVAVRPRRTAG